MYYQLAYAYVYYVQMYPSSSKRSCKALWDLNAIPYIVNALYMMGRERVQSLKGSRTKSQLCGTLALGLHYATLLRKFTRVMQTKDTSGRQAHRWLQKGKCGQILFRGPLEMSNWSALTRKSPRSALVGFISTTGNLALLTTLCRARGTYSVKQAMMSWRKESPHVSIEHKLMNGTF